MRKIISERLKILLLFILCLSISKQVLATTDCFIFDDTTYDRNMTYNNGYSNFFQNNYSGCRISNPYAKIIHLPQIHWMTYMEQQSEDMFYVAYSQFEIIKFIEQNPGYTIFSERLQYEYFASALSSETIGAIYYEFPYGYIPSDFNSLSERQKSILAKEGADFVLLALGKVRSIKPSIDPQRWGEIMSGIDMNFLNTGDPQVEYKIFVQRERELYNQVTKHLAVYPEDRILIIYGAAHYLDYLFRNQYTFDRANCGSIYLRYRPDDIRRLPHAY